MVLPRVRLWIEYALIAAVIVATGLAVTVKMESLRQENVIASLNNSVSRMSDDLALLTGVNDVQEEAIKQLSDQRKLDGDRILELIDQYAVLSRQDKLLRNQLMSLEKDDEAKTYLDLPLPLSVSCLYDGSCAATSSGGDQDGKGLSPEGTSGSVRPPP